MIAFWGSFVLESSLVASVGKLVKQGEETFTVGVGRWWCMYCQSTLCLEKPLNFLLPKEMIDVRPNALNENK